jgi:2,4-dienoyl-CoA reductase (NADPH2)
VPAADVIFQPLEFRNLTVRNRLFRGSITGLMDHFDGRGSDVRLRFEERHAQSGVGAIVSAHAPIHVRGQLGPSIAQIDRDERIPFWREVVRRAHAHDCRYVIQLVHAGRQREVARIVQYETGISSTDRPEPYRGSATERMSKEQIAAVVDDYAQAARRAREAGADGVEIHGANGFLITQFLSKAINDRTDEYGGPLENRARLALEIVRAVRREVGDDYHVQFKISAVERVREVYPWRREGNTIDDSVQVCRWLEDAGIDAVHVSTGTAFPHPRMPPGRFPVEEAKHEWGRFSNRHWMGTLLFHSPVGALFRRYWDRNVKGREEGILLPDAAALKKALTVPVICSGGFQTASVIASAIDSGKCDGVSISRPLIANPDLVRLFEAGVDRPAKPCTYSNKCIGNFLIYPIGCYDESRYASREEMVREIMSLYDVPAD